MKRLVALALALSLLLPDTAAAQQAGRNRFPRKWLGAAIGMAITGAAALAYASVGREDFGSECSSTSCVTALSLSVGFLSGFLIGREYDQLYAQRYRHGPPIRLGSENTRLSLYANDIAARGGVVATAGDGGVELARAVDPRARPELRARGLRAVVTAQPDPGRDRLLVGTAVGLFGFALRGERVAGGLLRPGEVSAAAIHGDRILVGGRAEVSLAVVAGDTLASSGAPRPVGDRVADLAWNQSGEVAWVLTETALIAYAVADTGLSDSLGALAVPGTGRRLAVLGDSVAIAAGAGGILVVDAADPRLLRPLTSWTGPNFAYDVAAAGRLLYVAAGGEGLYVLAAQPDGSLAALGLDRGVGFAAALERDGAYLWLLDRAGNLLRRIDVEP
jgi:hypothetical protein